MRVITARNVHEALPLGLRLLEQEGQLRGSRNGDVYVAPYPVTTVYERPCERVLFWPQRDANPFFHLYESLWMLAGRNDVAGVAKYAKNMQNYSDNGTTFHGAYGHRWRHHYGEMETHESGIGGYSEWVDVDQLKIIAEVLQKNSEDRRCVLTMWDPNEDLGKQGKDFPCNLTATFQRNSEGRLDLTVFCRSNDILWGCYGANAVHFSFLLEYMSLWIGCPVGVYRQISVNWHGYVNTLKQVGGLWQKEIDNTGFIDNPYIDKRVRHINMGPSIEIIDKEIKQVLSAADSNLMNSSAETRPTKSYCPWAYEMHLVLEAHEVFRNKTDPQRFEKALSILSEGDQQCDWNVAAREWILRRQVNANKL